VGTYKIITLGDFNSSKQREGYKTDRGSDKEKVRETEKGRELH
jgi:hypothetical protein